MTECIKWHLHIHQNGYGQANLPGTNGKHMNAHRFVWIQTYGKIPKGMVVDHICHTEAVQRDECDGGFNCKHRSCVNIEHLRLVSQKVNIVTGKHSIDNRSNCNQGHPFTKENIMIRTNGKRECAECNRVRARRNYALSKGA